MKFRLHCSLNKFLIFISSINLYVVVLALAWVLMTITKITTVRFFTKADDMVSRNEIEKVNFFNLQIRWILEKSFKQKIFQNFFPSLNEIGLTCQCQPIAQISMTITNSYSNWRHSSDVQFEILSRMNKTTTTPCHTTHR